MARPGARRPRTRRAPCRSSRTPPTSPRYRTAPATARMFSAFRSQTASWSDCRLPVLPNRSLTCRILAAGPSATCVHGDEVNPLNVRSHRPRSAHDTEITVDHPRVPEWSGCARDSAWRRASVRCPGAARACRDHVGRRSGDTDVDDRIAAIDDAVGESVGVRGEFALFGEGR
jgi:hypothetical protein